MLYLDDILTASQKITRYCKGMVFEDFRADERTYDAVIRNLEIIGEAAKSVPEEIREKYPAIQWREMAALRNIVAHQYFGVKDEIIWDVIANKIPNLITHVQAVINDFSK
jgi:uncharacterized protein with HEPN domain